MAGRFTASLSRKLVLVQGCVLVLIFTITGVALDRIYRQIAADAVRERLQLSATAIGSELRLQADGGLDQAALEPVMTFSNVASGRYVVVRDEHGKVVWQSPGPGMFGFEIGELPATGSEQFRDEVPQRGTGRIALLSRRLDLGPPGAATRNVVLTVAERRDTGLQPPASFRRGMVLWFSAATLCVLGVLAALRHQVLGPLRRLEEEIAEVDAGKRSELGAGYPPELASLADVLNGLLRGERDRLRRYRDTLGNLAHSLKTPLASMRALLAQQPPEIRSAFDREIDRIALLAEQQLLRAGTAGPATLGQKPIPVLPLLVELRTAMLRVHGAKDLSIELVVEPAAGFLGDRSDLFELLGNVLDNGCKWCGSRVQVTVYLAEHPGSAPRLQIAVADDGAGIDPADRGRVLVRGVRADERAPGHGIGLAMVADTVAVYRGELSIGRSESLGGACITIGLPGRLLDADSVIRLRP
jgi:two-component system sensor histidine kinase PhoQ